MSRPTDHAVPPPALGIARGRRVTNRQIADTLGCSSGWVGEVLLGYVGAPARFRQGLAELLDVDEETLFPTYTATTAEL